MDYGVVHAVHSIWPGQREQVMCCGPGGTCNEFLADRVRAALEAGGCAALEWVIPHVSTRSRGLPEQEATAAWGQGAEDLVASGAERAERDGTVKARGARRP